MKRRTSLLRPLVVALLLASGAVPAQAMDLLEAWHASLQADPTLAAARAGAEAGQHLGEQARALQRPQVALNASAGLANMYNKTSDAQFSAPGMGAASGAVFKTQTDQGLDMRWNVSVAQPLIDARRSSNARQLDKQAQMAETRLGIEEQQLMLRVAKAYFDVLLGEETLATVQAQKAAVNEALQIAQARFEAGDVAIIDTQEAQARADALLSQELSADSQLQLARDLLRDLTAQAADTLVRLPEKTDMRRFQPGEMAEWVALAQRNSPDLRIQALQRDIARDEIDKHLAANAPVLDLVARVGGENLSALGGGHQSELTAHDVSLGVQLTIPIFTGGMRDAKLGESRALADKAGYELEAARLRAGQSARAAWQGLTVGQSRVKALEQALASSQVRLDATRLGKDVGDRTGLDVLNAEQEHYSAMRELAQARYQLLLSYLSLYASAGELTEQRLGEVNAALMANH